MKILITLSLILFTTLSFGQNFKKFIINNNKYSISDSINIKDGHGEIVKVFFQGVFPKLIWDNYVQDRKYKQDSLNKAYSVNYVTTDSTVFSFLAQMLALKASFVLKNKESFVPFKSQFFLWYERESKFMTDFKMMGRNGYGNLVETSSIVTYID